MKRWLFLASFAMVLPGVALAQTGSTGDYPELEKLIGAFRDAEVRGDLVTTADPDVLSPFGGPSQLPSETTGPVTLEGTFQAIFNPTGQPVYPFDGPGMGGLRPPFALMPDGAPPSYTTGGMWSAPPIDELANGQVPSLPYPPLGLPQSGFSEFLGPDAHVVGDTTGLLDGPLVVHGAMVDTPIPMTCPGRLFEFGRVDAIDGSPIWDGFAENDIFNGGSQAIVTRCFDGSWEVERLVNQGSQFLSAPTGTVTIVLDMGWMSFTPLDELMGTTGSRQFGFVTPTDNPYQPETTGFTAVPFPGLTDPGIPVILSDPSRYLPGPAVWASPTGIEYIDGSCPPTEWSGQFELFLVDGVGGPTAYLEQLGTGQVVSGPATVGPDGTPILDLVGSGPGYTETYEGPASSGTYTHSNADTCTWSMGIDPGVMVEFGSAVTALAQESTTTTTAETTTTTASPATTAAPGDGGGALWPWVLIGLGVALALVGGILWFRPKDPCEELRKAWEAAERRRKMAQDGLDQARQNHRARKDRVSEVESSLAALEKSAQSSITEHGVTYHLIEGGRVTAEGLQSLLDGARRDLADARAAEADAANSVKDWEGRVAEANAAADEAKAAYERCVGEHTPKTPEPGPGTTGEPGGTVAGPGGPAVATPPPPEEPPECETGATEVRPAGRADTINVTVDFSIFIEVMEGSGRQVEAGKTLAIDLSNLAGELGTLGSLLGAYGSGRSLGQGATALQTGKYTVAGGKIARGGVEGYIAGADPNIGTDSFPISIPTSPQEAVTEVLEATARLGSIVAGKVSEWMEMNQLLRIRMTYFYQSITATPYQVWVCEAGRWVCKEKIYEVEVGKLQRRPGPQQGPFRLESDMARHRFDREVQRMTQRGRSELESSVRRRIEFEQAHQPGPCE